MMARRVLLVHNRYRQAGGEDRVVETESALLRRFGHTVFNYYDDNDRVGNLTNIQLATQTVWSRPSYRELLRLIRDERIDLCHFHNTFPLISPSAYYAARRAAVPVVQTLHNYRLLCLNSYLMRNGTVCEDCLHHRAPWPGALRKCYRNSHSASAVTAAMLGTHRILGTWRHMIDRYIALTPFALAKFVEGGLPASRLTVKPNFVDPDPGVGDGAGGYALYVGRFSAEKGLDTLLRAWGLLSADLPLHLAGGGPLEAQVRNAASENKNVRWLGELSQAGIRNQMKGAKFLVCPSIWYESFPLVVVEAFSTGLPVIASNIGSLSTIVEHQHTGLHFGPVTRRIWPRRLNGDLATRRSLERCESARGGNSHRGIRLRSTIEPFSQFTRKPARASPGRRTCKRLN